MYRIGVVSLFAELIDPVTQHGVVGRACERGLIEVMHESPRAFTSDRHRTVDDRPYGGGPGMVLCYEPMRGAIGALRQGLPADTRALVLSAQGRAFDGGLAGELARAPGLLLVAGRYEGLDERIIEAEGLEEVSVGDYVLSGGELAAAVVIDAVARLLPGVLGHEESGARDSHMHGLLGYPQYTRPEIVDGMAVPEVLLGGNHERIRRWRLKRALGRTWRRRPDLLKARVLSDEERELLAEYRVEAAAAEPGSGMS